MASDDDIYSFTITNVECEKKYDLLVKISNYNKILTFGYTTFIDN